VVSTANRTAVTLNGVARSYATASTSNRLQSLSNPARSFTYDNAGNTLSDSASYNAVYGLDGRLSQLSAGGRQMSLAYDANGLRVRRQITGGSNPGVTYYTYDQQGQLLGEYALVAGQLTALMEYVWLEGVPVAAIRPTAGGAHEVFYIHSDHLSAPRVALDSQGRVRWRWMAEPFGATAAETNPAGLGDVNVTLRLPGQQADEFVGLHYNVFRDYDPTVGRYATPDPIGLEGGSASLYGYAEGNPVSLSDRLGLAPNDPTDGRPGAPAIGVPNPSAQAQRDITRQLSDLFCDPGCVELQARMEELAGELRQRYVAMTGDAQNLFCSNPIGKFSWAGHQIKYQNKQRQLQKLIQKARAQGCQVNPEHERLTLLPAPFCPSR